MTPTRPGEPSEETEGAGASDEADASGEESAKPTPVSDANGEVPGEENSGEPGPTSPVKTPAANLTPKEALAKARAAFEELRIGAIRPLLEPILEPEPKLTNKNDRIEARILLGVSLFIQAESTGEDKANEREELLELASKQFLEALREDPEFELDAQLYPRIVVDFFESVRTANKEELDKLRDKNGNGPNKTGISDTIYIERGTRRNSLGLNFLPFGFGQFQNGHPARGTFYATVQGFALASNVGFYLRQYQLVYDVDLQFPVDSNGLDGPERISAEGARLGMWVSLGVLAAVYLVSVADGLYFYEPEKVEYLRTLPGPPPELDPNNRLPDAPTLFQWQWRF